MRIPWYIVTLLSLLVFGGGLWLGVYKQDFTVPPSEEEIEASVSDWKQKHPPMPPRQRALPVLQPEEQATEEEPEPIIPTIALGDLTTSPALDHYHDHKEQLAESFIKLAIDLESKGHETHALLAWERVIDSSDPDANQMETAHLAIKQLREKSPIWAVDEKSSTPLTLHISTPEIWKAEISALLAEVTNTIREASSYLASPAVLIKTIPQREGFPTPPIRIWLSGSGNPAKETPQLTFLGTSSPSAANTGNKDSSTKHKLYHALYRTIQNHLAQFNTTQAPIDIATADSPRDALTTYLTRLHWSTLIDSLEPEEAEAAPAAIIIEETNDTVEDQ